MILVIFSSSRRGSHPIVIICGDSDESLTSYLFEVSHPSYRYYPAYKIDTWINFAPVSNFRTIAPYVLVVVLKIISDAET